MRLSLRFGFLIISLATLTVFWDGVCAASVGQSSLPVHGGYGANEEFCAPQPVMGTLTYRVSSGRVTVRAALKHLPNGALVGVNWANDAVRGYLIGTVRSNERGDSIPASEKLFRPAESRGYKVVLTWPTNTQTLATMWPCRSPAAATVQCERVIRSNVPTTAPSLDSCLSGTLIVRHLCPAPSTTIFVYWHGRTFILAEGQKPVELPEQFGMGAISQACGIPGEGLPSAEAVKASPSTGLQDGQHVMINVQGFKSGVPGTKFFLSECQSPSQVNELGCGKQLAAQPFGLTDSNGDGSGSVSFTVQSHAATQPLSSVLVPCSGACVIVATTGAGGIYGFVPIDFSG